METLTNSTIKTKSLRATAEAARRLLSEDQPPLTFFNELLKVLVDGDVESIAGVWMAGPSQQMTLFADHGFAASGLLKERRQSQANQELLLKGWLATTPTLLELGSLTENADQHHQCLLVPLFQGKQRIGVLQVLTSGIDWPASDDVDRASSSEESTRRDASPEQQYAFDIMESAHRSLDRAEAALKALDPGQFQPLFATFCSRLHQSLDPRVVGITAVNETCTHLGCDRAWLFERSGSQWRLRQVSGQRRMRHSSPQVRQLKALIRQVAPTGQRFVFAGQELNVPESVLKSLMTYVHESGAQSLVLEPLFPPEPVEKESASKRKRPTALLICEQFEDNLPAPGLLHHLPAWGEQIALALQNAKVHSRLLLLPGMKFLSQLFDGIYSSRLATAMALFGTLAAVVMGLCAVETELRIQSRGHLMPVVRRHVYAPLEGEIAEVFIRESEVVEQGQPLLRLRSPQLELNQLTLASQLQERMQHREAIRAQLRTSLTGRDRAESARTQAQLESVTIEINALERRLALLAEEQAKLVVTAPIRGTITTPQPESRLINCPVQRGEALLEVMDEKGPWRIELEIPERRAGHVLGRLQENIHPEVSYRLTALAQQEWSSKLTTLGDRTALSGEYGTVVNGYCDVDMEELPLQRIGADLTARVHCGPRSLMFVYFGEAWEYLQRKWWF